MRKLMINLEQVSCDIANRWIVDNPNQSRTGKSSLRNTESSENGRDVIECNIFIIDNIRADSSIS